MTKYLKLYPHPVVLLLSNGTVVSAFIRYLDNGSGTRKGHSHKSDCGTRLVRSRTV